jgi:putative tricarboxylic transport membrane protein
MVLGVVLGFMVESNYRRALVLSDGDHMIFIQDRLSLVLLSLGCVFVVGSLLSSRRRGATDKDMEPNAEPKE